MPNIYPKAVTIIEDDGTPVDWDSIGGGGGGDSTIVAPLGRAADAASVSTALSTEDVAILGAANETAPASDTASSGLNGRLQRIAQRLTSLIALLPASLGQKTAANSLAVVLASDSATEAHLGEVGGNSTGVKVALTVSTSPAYTAGDSIGGKITIANALRAAGHNVVLQNVHILDRANQKPTGSILIFDADPSAATLTDNAAFVYSTDDLKQIARIPVVSSDWATINSKATASLSNLGRVLTAASGTTLYAAFVTDSTPTFAATSDVQIIFGFLRD